MYQYITFDMVQFVIIEDGSYRVTGDRKMRRGDTSVSTNSGTTNTSNTNHIFECTDPVCVYSRKVTFMREKFENKIVK